jgi:hypothetical protein
MLSPEIARRLDLLLATYTEGFLTEDEFAQHLGHLVTADNLGAVLDRVPPPLLEAVKQGINLDNQRAAGNECLWPEDSPFDDGLFSEYYRQVGAALLEPGVPNRRGLLSVVCLPSFEVEWALRLLGDEKKGYAVALSVAETQIWAHCCASYSSRATVPIAVRRVEAPLAGELGSLLCEVWRRMLLRVRHPQSRGIGLDGVSYHFACHGPGVGYMAGKTWSPGPQTAPGTLVGLAHLLFQYTEATDLSRRELIGEIYRVAAGLK